MFKTQFKCAKVFAGRSPLEVSAARAHAVRQMTDFPFRTTAHVTLPIRYNPLCLVSRKGQRCQRKRCVPNATGKERLRVLLVAALERDLSQVSPSVPASSATDVDTAAASVAVVWAKLNRRTIGHEFCETVRLERKFCQCASPLETVPLQRPAEVPSPPSICRPITAMACS